MKQYLLLLPMMCLTATTSMAQTSYDTAIEAKMGENTYNVDGDDMQTIIWKYTASSAWVHCPTHTTIRQYAACKERTPSI